MNIPPESRPRPGFLGREEAHAVALAIRAAGAEGRSRRHDRWEDGVNVVDYSVSITLADTVTGDVVVRKVPSVADAPRVVAEARSELRQRAAATRRRIALERSMDQE